MSKQLLVPVSCFIALLGLSAAGCAAAPEAAKDGRPLVVATTGMIADLARNIAGDAVRVEALMGPGVDPHLYKASESDVRLISGADLVLYNGLHLEGKMTGILSALGRRRRVLALAETLPPDQLRSPPEFKGQHDPHVWFDVKLWSETIDPAAAEIIRLVPGQQGTLEENASRYHSQLLELDAWVADRIRQIPPSRRVLITAHDAFGYFGRRYGLRVVGLQGMSTVSEAGLTDIERVTRIVTAAKIPAVFIESSVPRRTVEALQAACRNAGVPVAIGGELYSDALGAPGTPEGHYIGMVRHNVETIVGALR